MDAVEARFHSCRHCDTINALILMFKHSFKDRLLSNCYRPLTLKSIHDTMANVDQLMLTFPDIRLRPDSVVQSVKNHLFRDDTLHPYAALRLLTPYAFEGRNRALKKCYTRRKALSIISSS
jgi:hypothetical protein